MVKTVFGKLLFLIIAHLAACSFVPPSVGGGSESSVSLSDVTQRKSGSEYVALGNGRTSKAQDHGYEKGEQEDQGHNQEGGHYSDQDNNQKSYDVGRRSQGQSQSQNHGDNEFKQHGSGDYKKGYHKSGFTNNYHKDESGNKASFYEDSDDERGHRGYDSRGGSYGQKGEDAYRDGRYDAGFNGRNKGNQGNYDKSAGYDNRRGHSGDYNDNRYQDDRRDYLHDGSGRYFDRNGNEVYYRREQQQPYQKSGYYPAAPLVSGPLYSRDYLDAPPPRYNHYESPHRGAGSHGYFPSRREYHQTELIYPEKNIRYDDSYIRGGVGHRGGGGYGGGGGHGGSYGGGGGYKSGYSGGYGGAGYRKGYHQPLNIHGGYDRHY